MTKRHSVMLVLVGLVTTARFAVAAPVAGTCVVKNFFNTLYGGVQGQDISPDSRPKFPIAGVSGLALPVEIDAQAGTIAFDRTRFETGTFSISGVSNTLTLFGSVTGKIGTDEVDTTLSVPAVIRGTIDAGGNVTLPDFEAVFQTAIAPDAIVPIAPTLSTGLGETVLNGVVQTEGVPLDFSTGLLTLEGHVTATKVPVVTTVVTGMRFTCQLNPIPAQSDLPKAPQLTKVAGVARVAASLADGDKGDTLVLKAKLAAGKTPLPVDGTADVFVQIATPERHLALLLVRAGEFRVKGSRISAQRDDTCVKKKGAETGTCRLPRDLGCKDASDCGKFDKIDLDVVLGRKGDATAKSVLGGTIALTKRGALSVKAQGLDLSALQGTVTVSVQVGTQYVSAPVTVSGTGSVRRLKSPQRR